MSTAADALVPFMLRGKVALVTGAAAGLGKAVSQLFLQVGASVVLTDVDEPALQGAEAELRVHGPTLAVLCDVADAASVQRAFATAAARFGGVDVLVNNAAYRRKAMTMDMPLEDWDRAHAVIARGSFLCMREAAAHMRQRGGGAIVNVSTMSVSHPTINANMHYDSAKAGVEAMTRHAALDFAADQIRVNWVAPGAMTSPGATAMAAAATSGTGPSIAGPAAQPGRYLLGRKADPMEVARVVLFLASEAASYITGTGVLVDGGFAIS